MKNYSAFREAVSQPILDVPKAALCFAKGIAYPDLDVAEYLQRLRKLGEDAAEVISPYLPVFSRAEKLADFLFSERGFQGNTQSYQDPRNSFLNQVIDRRLGLPITLSVLYVALAERLSIPAAGVGLPGHYVVKIQPPEGELLLDPFYGGRLLSEDDCMHLVKASTSFHGSFNRAWLRPVSAQATLTRMLNNLRNIFLTQQDWVSSLAVLEHLTILQPDIPDLLRDMALLHHQLGELRPAVDYYELYLERTPSAPDADKMRRNLRLAAQQIARLN